MILQIDHYDSLEGLQSDIVQAAKDNPQHLYDIETPMKVELSKDNYNKVKKDLQSHGSYAGLRTENEFMINQWNVSGIQVAFLEPKE